MPKGTRILVKHYLILLLYIEGVPGPYSYLEEIHFGIKNTEIKKNGQFPL